MNLASNLRTIGKHVISPHFRRNIRIFYIIAKDSNTLIFGELSCIIQYKARNSAYSFQMEIA